MKELRYTLLSDGPSDETLIPILSWALQQNGIHFAIQPTWADFRRLRRPPRKLSDRIKIGLDLYPCDLLFIHRDAEGVTREIRLSEIHEARKEVESSTSIPHTICVVPVRMQEAWLLFDEMALRRAAGNPNGRVPLEFPYVSDLEKLSDPKRIFHELIREASGLSGRRRKHIPVHKYARRVAELIDDFSPLRKLSAFAALETEIQRVISEQGWDVKSR